METLAVCVFTINLIAMMILYVYLLTKGAVLCQENEEITAKYESEKNLLNSSRTNGI